MKIYGSIRSKLIIAIFLGCLIPYAIGGGYLKSYTEAWLYNNSVENNNQLLHRVRALIDDALVNDIREEVNMLASMESVKKAKHNLQNYTRFDRETFRYQPGDLEKELEEQFRLLKISHKAVNFVFFGTDDGGYMEYPRFQPSQAYEPRLRPWYQYTLYEDDVRISEPYLTKVTEEMVVSFTKRIRNHAGEGVGVLGITVNLYDLTTSINNTKIGDSGYILLMSPQHKFLVSPYQPAWIMKTPEELGLSSFKPLGREEETVFESVMDNVEHVLSVVTSKETGWHIISVVEKDEILQKAKAVTNILLIIYAMTFALIVVIVYQISKRFTTPILEISSVISRMTDFDFNFSTNLKAYTKQKDEIGTVTAALVDMHDNYTEFIDQVNYIDKAIQNIDIEKNELIKVEVSKNNPFLSVIDSMNILLAKIHQYFNQLNFLVLHDSLTKLPNRRQFVDLLNDKLRDKKTGAVILLDLDDFKGINDTMGHVFGDRVIEAIADRLSEIGNDRTVVCRFGGDEFLVLCERTGNPGEIDLLIHQIQGVFNSLIRIDSNDIEIRFSMGISLFPEDGTDVDQLVMNADLAMYSVKNSGKNGYQYFSTGMMNSQISKSKIEVRLRDAMEKDGFYIVYQPQVELMTGEIKGYEALLRLKDSDLSPGEFVPVAEINGSIIRIGRIVTEKVIRQLAEWRDSGMELKPVSINFSANQLHDSGYLQFIDDLMKEYGILPRYIEIEITESIFLENKQATMAFLIKLKEMGISISIDDFGTGYSSLNYLTFLPVDKIKLDRSLSVRFLEMDSINVMNSLISLVHSLGLTVIAEGIETAAQVQRLKDAECDYIQGYYYSKPLEPDRIEEIHLKTFL